MSRIPFKHLAALLSVIGLLLSATLVQAAPIPVPGFLKFEAYTNITGSVVNDLLNAPSYPDSPGAVLYMTSFDTRTVYPNDSHENYGGRISGFLTPTESGDYYFFLRSDDASELSISPDDNPANLELIGQETTCCGAFEEPGAPETSALRTLVAGQRYAIQALYKEGTGGDYCQVAWRKADDTTPTSQLRPIPSAFLSTLIPAQGSVAITKNPTNATAARNDFVTLSVEFTATHGPVIVQWQKNGTNVPGVTGGTVDYGPLSPSDNGAKVRAVVSIPGAVTNSAEAMLTVTPDVTRPTIKSVVGSGTFDTVTVEFSEAVMDQTDTFSYSLDGGLSVDVVTVLNPTTVKLTTNPQQAPGATYTLTVNGIADTAGNQVAPGTSRTFSAFDRVRGGLKFEAWFNIGGTAVSALTGDPRYPASPDQVGYITQFTSRQIYPDAASVDNYGGRLSGWIVPPENAEYEFFIRSDDNSELRLSPDDDPANAVLIASEGGCCGPFEEPGAPETSLPIMLMAGQRYYIEALWKEGGGGDYCDVAWRKVGTPGPAIALTYIPGSVLETYAAPGTFTPPTVAFSSPANGSTFAAGAGVTLTATASAASGKSIVKVEFFELGKKIGEATRNPYSINLFDLSEDNHAFIARATDSAGLYVDSAPLNISVGGEVQQLTLVGINDVTTFRYDRTGRDLGTDWRENNYDDSTWPEGKTLIADESTATVEPIRTRVSRFNDMGEYVKTFYFRTHFNFNQPVSSGVKLRLRHVVDDGVVLYLNNVEIHRFGIAAGPVNAGTDATGHENTYEGPFDLPTDQLRSGDNVLAAEVHQSGGSSSDMVFGTELIATVPVIRTNLAVVAIDDVTTFRYDRTGRDLGTDWRENNYDDSTWPLGKTLIADESTATVEPIRTRVSRFNDMGEYVKTFYFRTHFNFSATTKERAKIKLRHVVDDGVVFYLNNMEIHRFGIAAGPVNAGTDATGHENTYEGPFDIPTDQLRLGDNVLTAEVHQSGGSSSDMVFGTEFIISVPVSNLGATRPVLSISRSGASVNISWTPSGGALESAPAVTGPWSPIANASNPYATTADGSARFYRIAR